jgi:two-component system response regulator AtoC
VARIALEFRFQGDQIKSLDTIMENKMADKPGILVVDDDEKARTIIGINLRPQYRVHLAASGREALHILEREPVHLILSDLRMADIDGMSLLKSVRAKSPEISFIMMTAYGTVENAVTAMKQGAFDYILKPIKISEIELAVEKALAHAHLLRENRQLKDALRKTGGMPEIITANPRMQALLKKVQQVAPTQAAVLISGESGTGKELIAGAVHRLSPRAESPLVDINCAAIPRDLLESELFGHEKGAFTGAIAQKRGKLHDADGGTLFLDEIGELPVTLQAKLLRVLETGRFSRVGGNKILEADFRVIAATNRNLKDAMREGRFRADLFYRLNVVSIEIPPLRERPEDIPLLVHHFLVKHARNVKKSARAVDPAAMDLLRSFPWPGNIRELENVVLQAMVLAEGAEIGPQHLPEEVRSAAAEPANEIPRNKRELVQARSLACESIERRFLQAALDRNKGNVSHTAMETGFSRRNLQMMMRKYRLDHSAQNGE